MGRKRIALIEKELLFCRYFAETCSARESAAKAGYTFPERSAIKLLQNESVKEEIRRLFRQEEKNNMRFLVMNGYKRLAFGSVADAISLIFKGNEISEKKLEGLDLFCISEIKRPKDGSLEIKFFDRLDALHQLREMSEADDAESSAPFYEALCQGASALSVSSSETEVL